MQIRHKKSSLDHNSKQRFSREVKKTSFPTNFRQKILNLNEFNFFVQCQFLLEWMIGDASQILTCRLPNYVRIQSSFLYLTRDSLTQAVFNVVNYCWSSWYGSSQWGHNTETNVTFEWSMIKITTEFCRHVGNSLKS